MILNVEAEWKGGAAWTEGVTLLRERHNPFSIMKFGCTPEPGEQEKDKFHRREQNGAY